MPDLHVENLSVAFPTARGPVHALQDVSLALPAGGALALVGESGSGKSTVVLALLGLLGTARVTAQRLAFDTTNLLTQAATIRGRRLAVVFQDPSSALNPALSIATQMTEPLILHAHESPTTARQHATDLLAEVGLPRPAALMDCYPHQLSGGMKQRVAIAMALAAHPDLLLLDEPTTALDVTTRETMNAELQRIWMERRKTVLLITHSIAEAVYLADRVLVMGARPGRVVGEVKIDLPRPRQLEMAESPEFGRYAAAVRRLLNARSALD